VGTEEEGARGGVVDPEFELFLIVGDEEIWEAIVGEIDEGVPVHVGEGDCGIVEGTGEFGAPGDVETVLRRMYYWLTWKYWMNLDPTSLSLS
jgi:hypothetical protein